METFQVKFSELRMSYRNFRCTCIKLNGNYLVLWTESDSDFLNTSGNKETPCNFSCVDNICRMYTTLKSSDTALLKDFE